jgi:hypothetical protein
MLKYVRIAVTVLGLTACVLLVALWVRSYWWFDSTSIGGILSAKGRVYIQGSINFESEDLLNAPVPDVQMYQTRFGTNVIFARGVKITMVRADAVLPYWALTLLAAILATVPWLPWSNRFSLRTLLIVATLVAVVLGVVVLSS